MLIIVGTILGWLNIVVLGILVGRMILDHKSK